MTFVLRVVVVFAASIIYGYLYVPYFRAITRMDMEGMLLLLPALILVPLVAGVLVELLSFKFPWRPSWGQVFLLLVLLAGSIFFTTPLTRGPTEHGMWMMPVLTVFLGVLLGKALVGRKA